MNMQKIVYELKALSPEAQVEVIDFISFLRARQKPLKPRSLSKKALRKEPFIGLWKDRRDLQDSSSWVRSIRRDEWLG